MFKNKLESLLIEEKKKGISAAKIAEKLGLKRSQLTDWKVGRNIPSAENLQKLANYFNVSVDYLLEDDEADAGKFTANNNIQSTITQIDNSNANLNNNADFSQNESELIKIFRTLSFRSQIKVITYAYSVKDQEEE